MHNQNSKFFENALTGLCILEITALVHFPVEHFKQTADCASAAADALAAGIGDNDYISNTWQQPKLLSQSQLMFIISGLSII
jgi:hypothetical protein